MLPLVSSRPGPHVHVGNLGWLQPAISFQSSGHFVKLISTLKYTYEAFAALPKSEQFYAWLEDGADHT